jgi:hypothetical protein
MTERQRFTSLGRGLFGTLLTLAGIALAAIVGYAVFCEGRKAYWDKQVEEMCRKDGGITIYQNEKLTPEEYVRLGGSDHGFAIPNKNDKTSAFPYVREERDEKLRAQDPEVVRKETFIKRRNDDKALAKLVVYWRRGGDFIAIDAESSFICPRPSGDQTKQIFVIEEKHQ